MLASERVPSPVPEEGLNSLGPTGCKQWLDLRGTPWEALPSRRLPPHPARQAVQGRSLMATSPPPSLLSRSLSLSCQRSPPGRTQSTVVHPVPPVQGGCWLHRRAWGWMKAFPRLWSKVWTALRIASQNLNCQALSLTRRLFFFPYAHTYPLGWDHMCEM